MTEQQSQYAGLPRGSLIILQATVGSTVHGTAIVGTDDRDEMAICVEPPERAIGLHGFETNVFRTQPEGVRSGPGDLDLVIHTLRKFTYLAARGNPSILLPLYVPPTALIGKTHALGHRLREQRAAALEDRLQQALDSTSLPDAPDEAAIDRFVVDAYLWTWVPSRLGGAA